LKNNSKENNSLINKSSINEDFHVGIRIKETQDKENHNNDSIKSEQIKESKKLNYVYNEIIFPKYSNEDIKEAFDCFDLNLNGYISADEIKFIFGVINENIQNEEIDEMIKLADPEGNGQISWEKFLRFITGSVNIFYYFKF